MTMWFRSIPARRARWMDASSSAAISPITSRSGAMRAHCSGFPRMWLRINPAPACRTTFARSGSHVRPETSLMIDTPYLNASSAIPGLYVSTEIGMSSFPFSFFSTGIRRRDSSASEMRSEPGFVLSAPMSIRSAPCACSSSARCTAASGSLNSPPSVKESGVRFRTPTIRVRSPRVRELPRNFHSVRFRFIRIADRRSDQGWPRDWRDSSQKIPPHPPRWPHPA